MKTFGKIIIFIIVILVAVGVSYLMYDKEEENNGQDVTNITQNNTENIQDTNTSNKIEEDTEYVGIEENTEEPEGTEQESKPNEKENEEPKEESKAELTGEEKAIDIVKKQYALEGQMVRFHHMEGKDYIVKINDGTAVTWYLVDGTTWEAEEY